MKKLFGTDGIRGFVNKEPTTSETALKTGKAIASYCIKRQKSPKIIIGKDTRISGDTIMYALASGITSMGLDVIFAGVIPTPALAFLTKTLNPGLGVMITASHNPFYDNGIKLIGKNGYKLSDALEEEIEKIILDPNNRFLSSGISKTGQAHVLENPLKEYIEFLKKSARTDQLKKKIKIIADCANGAASFALCQLFADLPTDIEILFNQPNGININDNCGSEHPEILSAKVIQTKADLGIALDGDGDRLVAVDEKGNIIPGDALAAIYAKDYQDKNKLKNNSVVTTIMSNAGLSAAFKKMNITHYKSGVGDKYVMEKMIKTDSILGGEYSGHIIFGDNHTTGDGLLAALKLLKIIDQTQKPLSALAKIVTIMPQKVINVDIESKPDINKIPAVANAIKDAQEKLKDTGRVLVRYSGTQPKCRVMVEAEDTNRAETICKKIAEIIKKNIK
ncbi:MAG: phosphoglucosamine mutase [Deltaproteobacteria bacterium]|nr:phosphoglucosamine mutase [Deltaproteobacteria bacterium]